MAVAWLLARRLSARRGTHALHTCCTHAAHMPVGVVASRQATVCTPSSKACVARLSCYSRVTVRYFLRGSVWCEFTVTVANTQHSVLVPSVSLPQVAPCDVLTLPQVHYYHKSTLPLLSTLVPTSTKVGLRPLPLVPVLLPAAVPSPEPPPETVRALERDALEPIRMHQ